jgi:NitT/TauT family transport system permease protein
LAFTLKTCLIGYAIGASMGLLLGILTGEFRWFSTAIMPYISALQSLPKLTLAPLMIVWFGIGEPSKIATAALLTFFPLMINTYTGLMSVDPDMIDMMRSLNATRVQIFLKVRFPNSLPLIFTGLQMSIVYALLGTMLGEFLAGDTGLGMQIRDSLYTMETASMFSMMFLLTITGFVLQEIIRIIKRHLVFWSEMIELAST